MLKDVTIGQYYSTDSVVHRLDPRVKIRFTIIYIILLLIDRNLPLFTLLTCVFIAVVYMSKVPPVYMLRGIKPVLVFVLICSAFNMFTTPGDKLTGIGGLVITVQGMEKFGFVLWRMLLLIFMSSIIMYSTTPTELTDGMEKCFHLGRNTAMGITIALRFVSVLFGELDRIMKAQEARGADFHSGGPVRRMRSMRTVLIPLFQNSIDRSANLAEAMDARCYTGGKERTRLKSLTYNVQDIFCYIILLLLVAGAIWLAVRF